jgi:hypothetical protein
MSARIWVQRDPEMNWVISITLMPERICMDAPLCIYGMMCWERLLVSGAAENRKIILRRVGGDSVRGPCGLISRREKEPVCGK